MVLRTLATPESPTGHYPINAEGGHAPNYVVSHCGGILTVQRAVTGAFWETPEPVLYGTPLDERQLNAEAALPGTFTYDPPVGTVLPAGDHLLEAMFSG